MQTLTSTKVRGMRNITGFTLIEVMLVLVVVGLLVSAVQFTVSSNKLDKSLSHANQRFAGVFGLAVDYAMLNNVEMGVYFDVKEKTYQFVGFDGTRWSSIPEQKAFESHSLPVMVDMQLELEDLPIEEPMFYDAKTFETEEDDDTDYRRSEKSKEKKIVPQVYILSGGDITPFSVTFIPDEMEITDEVEDIAYRTTGIYSLPLTLEGPVLDE